MLVTQKSKALEIYKAARKAYFEQPTEEHWIAFCEAKRSCMLLGVRI